MGLPGTLDDPSPPMIVVGVLGTIEPEEVVTESKLGEDGEGLSNVVVGGLAEDRD